MIVADASVWVAAALAEDINHDVSRRALDEWMDAGGIVAAPTLLLSEVGGAVSRRSASDGLASSAVDALVHNPRLQFMPLDVSLATNAARLAIELHLRGADAIYVALARRLNAPLVTWDNDHLQRCGAVVTVSSPAEFAGSPE